MPSRQRLPHRLRIHRRIVQIRVPPAHLRHQVDHGALKDVLVGGLAPLDAPLDAANDKPAHAVQVALLRREVLLILERLIGVLLQELPCFFLVPAEDHVVEEVREVAPLLHVGVGKRGDLLAGGVLGHCDVVEPDAGEDTLEEGDLRVLVDGVVASTAVLLIFLLVLDLNVGGFVLGGCVVGGGLRLRVLLDDTELQEEVGLQGFDEDVLVAQVLEKLRVFRNRHVLGHLSDDFKKGICEVRRDVFVDVEDHDGAVSLDEVT